MSDNWGHYFASFGAYSGSVLFDDGFSQELESLPETLSILITIPLRETNEDLLPTQAEFERISPLEDDLLKILEADGAYEVGRVTYNSKRFIFYYGQSLDESQANHLKQIAASHGYDISVETTDDPDRRAYWDELYPTDDDRQVMMDLLVIRALAENGDIVGLDHQIEHLTIFSNKSNADEFARWAEQAGYILHQRYKDGPLFNKSYYVETHHIGPTQIGPLSKHSLAHFRKAKELGGTYDGWGCEVRKAN